MAFAGHLGGDNRDGGLKKHGYAEPFRMYREMDIPGIDAIWRQIFPGGRKERELDFDGDDPCPENHHFPRWASSAAHQAGSPWTLSESFAVYGQGLTPSEMKWIVNYQLARGVTLFCFATLASGVSGPYMAGERPVFNSADPMRCCLKEVNEYTSRLSYLLSLGSPVIKTALYMPVRDVWSGTQGSKSVTETYDAFARALERELVDFDIVDDDCLESARIVGNTLKCGAMAYETLVVPQCRHMGAAAAQKLSDFERAGDDVRRSPEGLSAGITTPPDGLALGVAVRSLENGRLYFIANEDTRELSFRARFPEKEAPLLFDAKTGDIRAFGYKIHENRVETELKLPFAGSVALFFGEKGELAFLPEPGIYNSSFEISAGWQFHRKKAFIIGEYELESRDIEENPRAAVLGPWLRYAGAEFSGEGVYLADFMCPEDAAGKNARLCLGRVEYACRCRLNGEELGLKAWPRYEYDISGKLKKGANSLEVTVINTAANQYVSSRSFEKWTAAELGCYHERALAFEKKSLGGGLFGRVIIEYGGANRRV